MIAQENTIYNYKVKGIDGKEINLADYKGKKVMIVNVASKCGFTPQYEQLQAIYEKYKDKDFVILGFPSNDFLRQEPGTNEEIQTFCSVNYGVTFPMMEKIKVKGKEKEPLYEFLTTKNLNEHSDNKVKWNFQKYLIGTDGKLEHVFYSRTKPDSEEIIKWIEGK